jgi:hypothetical protein
MAAAAGSGHMHVVVDGLHGGHQPKEAAAVLLESGPKSRTAGPFRTQF